ncbi:MAG TPA: ABC transporter substrate-binding protein [Natronosporangium sp.]|nr:ABC transporter substrate-binding protein [Natronosporangium sp.]
MRRHALLLTAAAALVLAGCAGNGSEPDNGGTAPAGDGFPVTVGEVTLQERPTAIVSLSATATEMLFAVGAGDQVVAVDEFSTYPPEAPTTDLSGFTPNVEAITTYDPDLVVISYDPGDLVAQLNALDIPVHLAPDNPSTLDDIYAQIEDIGALTGHADEARRLIEKMSSEIDAIVAEAPERDEPLTYYFEIENTLYAYTSASIVGTLLEMIGLENIAVADDPSQVSVQLSAEFIVDADPDFIFLANAQYGESVETVSAREGWAELTAVRTGRVVELSPDIHSRWGPRVVDLLREIADAVSRAE